MTLGRGDEAFERGVGGPGERGERSPGAFAIVIKGIRKAIANRECKGPVDRGTVKMVERSSRSVVAVDAFVCAVFVAHVFWQVALSAQRVRR